MRRRARLAFAERLAILAVAAQLLSSAAAWSAEGDARVADAARERDAAGVAALLRQGADVNARQPDGATALLWAAHWNDSALADLLIRAGANVDLANTYGVTPLSAASLNASVGMVGKLLNAGASPNTALPTGETVLMTAVRTGRLDLVKLLVARGADVNARETYRGQTGLMWALADGYLEIAQLLIEHGADVRTHSKGGFTPLMFAARQGSIDAGKLLLAHGADVNEAAPVVDAKESLTSGLSALHVATLRGHTDFAMFLLERGADPSADAPGYTPLHWASWISENYLTMDYPLAGGEWAAAGGIPSREAKLQLLKALLAKGANVNARAKLFPTYGHDQYNFNAMGILRGGGSFSGGWLIGATPFFLAASVGDIEIMKILVGAGADPMLGTEGETTPLMVAAGLARWPDESRLPEAVYLQATELCLELGNDINATNDYSNTALHAAAWAGFNSVVQLLVDKGANMNVRNKPGPTGARGKQGVTPMEAAADNAGMFGGHPETAALLKRLGTKE